MLSLSIGFNPDLWAIESVCRKTIKDERGKVDVYVFYFAFQAFPPHLWDYEPVIVYESNSEVTCLYDAFHYFIGCSRKPELVISYPWRSFYEGSTDDKFDFKSIPQQDLTDNLVSFWRSRRQNPFSLDEIFLEDPWRALEEFREGKRPRFGEEPKELAEITKAGYGEAEILHNELSFLLEVNEIMWNFKWPGLLAEYILSSRADESFQSFLASKCIGITLEAEKLVEIEKELRKFYKVASKHINALKAEKPQ